MFFFLRPPRYSRMTARGKQVSQGTNQIRIGPKSNPPLKAGRWIITVRNGHLTKGVDYRIAAFLSDEKDGIVAANPDLHGVVSSHSVEEEWELLEVESSTGASVIRTHRVDRLDAGIDLAAIDAADAKKLEAFGGAPYQPPAYRGDERRGAEMVELPPSYVPAGGAAGGVIGSVHGREDDMAAEYDLGEIHDFPDMLTQHSDLHVLG